ncbi:hypothetical protein E2C01_080330 [Portunus trituberculatus]|uniref:Uncharacterized protein n=1 Tax=Portunus trituberculatus TaxID=210409 RepID=A0A5B7ITT8_PORTR|nr:hypothetical protein [Portunus trituberculatus]
MEQTQMSNTSTHMQRLDAMQWHALQLVGRDGQQQEEQTGVIGRMCQALRAGGVSSQCMEASTMG